MYRFSLALLAVFMLAFSACTDDPDTVDELDDDDLMVEETPTDPYATGTDTGLYDTWDTNQDTYLDEDEYRTNYGQSGLYDTYDTDQDTYLSEDEYRTGYVGAGFDTEENFSEYDTDGDGRISREEFEAGLFSRMDADGDGRISREEFQRYESMLGGMGTGATGTGTTPAPADGM